MSGFMTLGTTVLLPKGGDTNNPTKYRPITCFPKLYKVLTSCITEKTYKYCDKNNLITEQ